MRRWFVIPAAVALLAIGVVTAGAALAQESDTEGSSTISSFASRVASILGLDEAQVQDAMNQAQRELHEEALKSRLDALVEAGRITQEQADQYLQWYQSRPDDFPGLGGPGFGFGHHGHGRGMKGFRGLWGIPQAPPAESAPSADSTSL
jgi:hypothetical protein